MPFLARKSLLLLIMHDREIAIISAHDCHHYRSRHARRRHFIKTSEEYRRIICFLPRNLAGDNLVIAGTPAYKIISEQHANKISALADTINIDR